VAMADTDDAADDDDLDCLAEKPTRRKNQK
jgi:hypothetical protein